MYSDICKSISICDILTVVNLCNGFLFSSRKSKLKPTLQNLVKI